MHANLAKALAFVDEDEGPELNIAASEPGGSSKHGVSMTVLREWHAAKGMPPPTMDDMKAVDSKLAAEIYAERFAKPIRFDDLPAGVDYRLLDITVNLGVTGGPTLFQRVLGLQPTGRISDADIAAAKSRDPAELISALGAGWLAYKKEHGDWKKYGDGWTNRAKRAEPRALALLAESTAPQPAKPPEQEPAKETPVTQLFPVKGQTSGWKGIIGVGMNVQKFRDFVASMEFKAWRPSFMVLHNTGAPKLSQWHSVSGEARMANLTNYYKNECHWSGGPHAFVADDLIWPFTPFNTPGVHAPSWNGIALGIELVGDYNVEDKDAGPGHAAYMNAVAVFGILHARLGLNPETIRFHKEDTKTDHKDCPGKDIVKSRFIQDVIEFMGEAGGHPDVIPIEVKPDPLKPVTKPADKPTATVNTDGLNMRERASSSSAIVGVLNKGAQVRVNHSDMNGDTKWTSIVAANGQWAWVNARYLTAD